MQQLRFVCRTVTAVMVLTAALAAPGCEDSVAPSASARAPTGAEMMQYASEIAVANLDQFIDALNHPQPSQRGFMIKAPFQAVDGSTEEIWISAENYIDGAFTGIIDHKPDNVISINVNDTVTVPRSDVIDWMYTDNDRLIGGWTWRVMIDRSTGEQRRLMMQRLNLSEDDLQLPPPLPEQSSVQEPAEN